jgi:hypothetical protein
MRIIKNIILDLTHSKASVANLQALFDASIGKGEGRIACTVTKHRLSKTAILLGVEILKKRPPSSVLELIDKWSPMAILPGVRLKRKRHRTTLVLECSSTQGLLEGVDQIFKHIDGRVSHSRVAKACFCLGLDSLARVDPGQVRMLVSKVSPVKKKYWDPGLGLWL